MLKPVTTDAFAAEVVEASRERPVLVDFWADWCGPCHQLTPILERAAAAYAGRIDAVKVNVDEETALAQRYGVRSLPTVKIFRDGEPVAELVGVQPEATLRELIAAHLPRPTDALLRAARQASDPAEACRLLEQARAAAPDDPEIALSLAEALAQCNEPERAEALLAHGVTAEHQAGDRADRLRALIEFARARLDAPPLAELEQRVEGAPDDLDARYRLAARYVEAGRPGDALEQGYEIMRRDRRYGDGLGRRCLVETQQLLDPHDPLAAEYRRKMASLLF